jgi:polyisoprenoid-binding protein YceI
MTMAASEQTTVPALQELLNGATLAGEWILDPSRSTVSLKSKSIAGLVTVNGVAASIDTKHTKRDTHLRSADFFDSDNYPDITFTVAGIRPSGQGVAVTGTLSVRGRARPLTFDGTAAVNGDGEVWLDATVHVNRADFGLTWNRLGMVSMHSTVTVHAVFTRR